MDKKVRVRFAPSPTGPLHIGGVRTALYNYLFAKKHGGDFLLRLEDTDQTRYVEEAESYIIEALRWCGLTTDEGIESGGEYGPYRQSERKELGIYKKYAEQLVESGNAYYAFDTPDELEKMRKNLKDSDATSHHYDATSRNTMKNSLTMSDEEVQKKIAEGVPYVVRVKIPQNIDVKFKDIVRGWLVVNSANLDDKVLYKSDGMPTYHLANVIDDYLMKITHVIRGEEWLPSAPLHVLLYRFLGWKEDMPEFAHLPLILKPTGQGKLSKRDGDAGGFPVFPIEWKSVEGEISSGYRESGYFPEAHINMLALLGWNPGTEQELFSLEELIKEFTLERVGKSGSKFDPDKTKWFNEQYLRATANDDLTKIIKPFIDIKGYMVDDNYLKGVCGLMKERVSFVSDIFENGKYFFEAPTSYDAKTVKKKWKDDSSKIVTDLAAIFSNSNFNAEDLEAAFKAYVEEKELGFGKAMIAIRLSITGVGGGPSLFEIMELIGKEESIKRLSAGIENIKKENAANG
jgi:glutamyl-tRNA synthetase